MSKRFLALTKPQVQFSARLEQFPKSMYIYVYQRCWRGRGRAKWWWGSISSIFSASPRKKRHRVMIPDDTIPNYIFLSVIIPDDIMPDDTLFRSGTIPGETLIRSDTISE